MYVFSFLNNKHIYGDLILLYFKTNVNRALVKYINWFVATALLGMSNTILYQHFKYIYYIVVGLIFKGVVTFYKNPILRLTLLYYFILSLSRILTVSYFISILVLREHFKKTLIFIIVYTANM